MSRLTGVLACTAILALGAGGFARTHAVEEPVDPSKGAKLVSRIPCDGATNPEDQVSLATMFSPGGWERSFRIERFEGEYCKRGDLGFACVQKGRSLWKQEWSADSSVPSAIGSYGLASCSDWGSKDAPEIILTGWYRDSDPDPKRPWKQAEVKKAASRWEVYEFTDPNGGTARVEIGRR